MEDMLSFVRQLGQLCMSMLVASGLRGWWVKNDCPWPQLLGLLEYLCCAQEPNGCMEHCWKDVFLGQKSLSLIRWRCARGNGFQASTLAERSEDCQGGTCHKTNTNLTWSKKLMRCIEDWKDGMTGFHRILIGLWQEPMFAVMNGLWTVIGVKGEAGPMQFECRALGRGSTNSFQHGSFSVGFWANRRFWWYCDLSCLSRILWACSSQTWHPFQLILRNVALQALKQLDVVALLWKREGEGWVNRSKHHQLLPRWREVLVDGTTRWSFMKLGKGRRVDVMFFPIAPRASSPSCGILL